MLKNCCKNVSLLLTFMIFDAVESSNVKVVEYYNYVFALMMTVLPLLFLQQLSKNICHYVKFRDNYFQGPSLLLNVVKKQSNTFFTQNFACKLLQPCQQHLFVTMDYHRGYLTGMQIKTDLRQCLYLHAFDNNMKHLNYT